MNNRRAKHPSKQMGDQKKKVLRTPKHTAKPKSSPHPSESITDPMPGK